MKFSCNGLDLCDAVLKVSKAISQKTTNPALEGIKVIAKENYVVFFATDTELSIEKKIKADVMLEGECVIPGKYFSDFVRKLDKEQVELYLNDKREIKISYLDSEGYLNTLSDEDYPAIETGETAQSLIVKSSDLKDIIAKTVFCAATEDSRPVLRGVLFEVETGSLTAVALDGYRLAKVTKKAEENTSKFNCIIPARALSEINKLIVDKDSNVEIHLESNRISLEIDGTRILSRLIAGEFINYRQIIPKAFETNVTVSRSQFTDGIERASILSKSDKNSLVKFDIKERVMTLISKSEIGNIKENLPISLSGKDLTIAFNSHYVMDALKVIGDEFVKLYFNSAVSPSVIKSVEGEEYLFLILPVRIVG